MNSAALDILSNVSAGHRYTFLLGTYLGLEFLGVCLTFTKLPNGFAKWYAILYSRWCMTPGWGGERERAMGERGT